jgi:hypothetical protein
MTSTSPGSRQAKSSQVVRRSEFAPELLERPITLAEAAYESVAACLMEGGYVPGDRLRGIAKRDAPMCVTGAASLFRIHRMGRIQNDYREAYPTPAGAAQMKQLTRFFAENGIVPNGAAASLSTPMRHADAEFIIDVFNGFLDTYVGQLDEVQSRK